VQLSRHPDCDALTPWFFDADRHPTILLSARSRTDRFCKAGSNARAGLLSSEEPAHRDGVLDNFVGSNARTAEVVGHPL